MNQFVRSLDVYEGKYFLERLHSGYHNQHALADVVIDENGMWKASLRDTNTKQEIKAAIPMSRLSREQIQRMVQEAKLYKFEEKEHKNKVREKNSLEKYVYDVRKIINDKKMEARFDAFEKKNIEVAVEKVTEWLASVQLAEVKDYKDKKVELQSIFDPILNKIREGAKEERNNVSVVDVGAGHNVPDGDSHSSAINCNDGTTKSRITFPHGDSKVELTSETKLTINCNNLDTALLPKIISKVKELAIAVAQNTYNELVRMLHAKIEHRSFSAIASADHSQSQNIKLARPDDGSACAKTKEAATLLDGGTDPKTNGSSASDRQGEIAGADDPPADCGSAEAFPPGH